MSPDFLVFHSWNNIRANHLARETTCRTPRGGTIEYRWSPAQERGADHTASLDGMQSFRADVSSTPRTSSRCVSVTTFRDARVRTSGCAFPRGLCPALPAYQLGLVEREQGPEPLIPPAPPPTPLSVSLPLSFSVRTMPRGPSLSIFRFFFLSFSFFVFFSLFCVSRAGRIVGPLPLPACSVELLEIEGGAPQPA